MVNSCKFQDSLTIPMTKQWMLPLKNYLAEIVDILSLKRKIQKHTDTKHLENDVQKACMEVAMLKLHQKDLIRNLWEVEFERDKLRNELEAVRTICADTKLASLVCFTKIIITGINIHASKLAQKRIKASVVQRCPEMMLEQLRLLFGFCHGLTEASQRDTP